MAGWPGMAGDNWGEQHAERWIWLHGLGFADRGADTWFDAAIGRVRLGPVTTPWVANGASAWTASASFSPVRQHVGSLVTHPGATVA